MASNNKYLEPMLPWPPLSQFGKKFNLPENKMSIFAYSAGDKENPALIMIHGLGDEADTWRHIISPLSNKFHVIGMDLPGFGRSNQPNTKYTPSFLMNSIVGLMDVCQIQKAILMGSSLGGILSHQIAIEHPDRVNGLVLIGGGLSNSSSMGDWQIRLMALPFLGEWFYTRLRKDPDAAYDSIRNVYHDLDQMPEKDREFLYERVNKRVWSDDQRRAYFSTLRELGSWIKRNQTASISLLKNLDIPTLAIRGAYDQIFSKNNIDDIAQNQPNVTVETIENAGHLPHQEKPNQFLTVVSNWLEIFIS